jgi:hypothetical protein
MSNYIGRRKLVGERPINQPRDPLATYTLDVCRQVVRYVVALKYFARDVVDAEAHLAVGEPVGRKINQTSLYSRDK